ncbi:MAG TPA: response regulator [Tichowtungia sp.]|nr:response regulator [Tichowtungia sp.]
MKTLLIVDDDRQLLQSFEAVFAGIYQVCTAGSAEEALPVIQTDPVDALLLDVILPGMSGVDLLRAIREFKPGLPIIMISASASIKPVVDAVKLGANDYVRKPFDIDELRLVVSRAIQTADVSRRLALLEDTHGRSLKKAVEDYERILIEKALRHTGGIQTRAAEELGTTRRILRYRIDKLQVEIPENG